MPTNGKNKATKSEPKKKAKALGGDLNQRQKNRAAKGAVAQSGRSPKKRKG